MVAADRPELFPACEAVRKPLNSLNGLAYSLRSHPVPNPPRARHREQPELPVTGPSPQELQHRLRVRAGFPSRFVQGLLLPEHGIERKATPFHAAPALGGGPGFRDPRQPASSRALARMGRASNRHSFVNLLTKIQDGRAWFRSRPRLVDGQRTKRVLRSPHGPNRFARTTRRPTPPPLRKGVAGEPLRLVHPRPSRHRTWPHPALAGVPPSSCRPNPLEHPQVSFGVSE